MQLYTLKEKETVFYLDEKLSTIHEKEWCCTDSMLQKLYLGRVDYLYRQYS